MTERDKLIQILKENPVKIANLAGFIDMVEIHNEWLKKMLFNTEDFTILGHRGSYKTSTLETAIALMMIINPNKNIIFLRKTDTDVKEVIKTVGKMLESPLFNRIVEILYGVKLGLIEQSAFNITTNLKTTINGTSQLLGIGINGSLTGKHADLVITDDIVNLKDRVSRAERENTKLIYMELQNIKNRGGRIMNTGTPWHKEDAISTMPNVEVYDCYSTGLIPKATIMQIREQMTPSLFSANYELKHIASEDALFTNPKFFNDDELLYNGVAHIDASYGGSDGTAFTILSQKEGSLYVLGKRWDKHVDDCKSEIYAIHETYKAGTIYMEKNGDKGYLHKEVIKDGYPSKSYQENTNKFIKISTQIKKHWSHIYFHENTDPEYLNEILDYTENAQHDDAPDSLASLIREKLGKKQWIH